MEVRQDLALTSLLPPPPPLSHPLSRPRASLPSIFFLKKGHDDRVDQHNRHQHQRPPDNLDSAGMASNGRVLDFSPPARQCCQRKWITAISLLKPREHIADNSDRVQYIHHHTHAYSVHPSPHTCPAPSTSITTHMRLPPPKKIK